MKKILGIDLGTANSCIAIIQDGKPIVIPNSEGNRLTPSIIAFEGESILVGDKAKRQALLNPKNTVISLKRLLGKKHSEITEIKKNLAYSIVPNEHDDIAIKIDNALYAPQELLAFILQKLKLDAEEYLGTEIVDVIITVPAKYNSEAIQITRQACEIVGLNVRRVISEPNAASMMYGNHIIGDSAVAIFDMGAGSLDISIVDIGDGVWDVKAIDGDLLLGGDDFDFVIVNWLINEIKQKESIDISNDAMILCRLKEAAEKAKIDLSSSMFAIIDLPYIAIGTEIRNLNFTITRQLFKSLSENLINRCVSVCKRALENAHNWGEPYLVDDIVYVGGATRIPFLKEAISQTFNVQSKRNINPDEIVALGAAIQGGILSGDIKDILLLDCTTINYGLKVWDGDENEFFSLIEENTTTPTRVHRAFLSYSDIAYVEEYNEAREKLKKYATLRRKIAPYMETKTLKPQFNGKYQNFELGIYESDGKTEKLIGKIFLNNILKLSDKPNTIEILFDINANHILTVQAVEKNSKISETIEINVQTSLTIEDVQKIKTKFNEIERNKRLEVIHIKTIIKAEAILKNSKMQLTEHDNNISIQSKLELQVHIDNLEKFISDKKYEEIEKTILHLNNKWGYVTQEIYLNSIESNNNIMNTAPIEIFISYSHSDEAFKDKLVKGLSPLKRMGLVNIWNDREIIPGTYWEKDGVYKNLEKAQLILTLISPDFIASDYCYDNEIQKALKRHKSAEVIVIPIVIRPTHWKKLALAQLQALPKDAKPVSSWPNEDEAWENIVEGIVKALDYIKHGNLRR
jgi:molecular chaperone DnaK